MALNVGQLFATLSLNSTQFNTALASSMAQLKTAGATANKEFDGMATSAGLLTTAITSATLAIGGFTAAVGAAVGFGIQQNAVLEQQKVAFTTLTGSVNLANAEIKRLKDLAMTTPFETTDLINAAQQYINVGLSAQTSRQYIVAMGDAVAASGGNMRDKMAGVTLAITQMLGNQRVSAEDMQQLTERGIPAWVALSKATGLSVAQLRKLSSEGKLGAEYVDLLVKQLGEMRKGAMEAQSLTFSGLLSNLKDIYSSVSQIVTENVFLSLKEQVRTLNNELLALRNNTTVVLELRLFASAAGEAFIGLVNSIKTALSSLQGDPLANLRNSLLNVAGLFSSLDASGFTGTFTVAISNSIAIAIDAFVAFTKTLSTLTQPIFNVLNAILGLKNIGTLIGVILALRVAMAGLVTITALTASVFNTLSVATATLTAIMNGQSILTTLQSGVYSVLAIKKAIFIKLAGQEAASSLANYNATQLEVAALMAKTGATDAESIAIGKVTFAVYQNMGAKLEAAAAELALAEAKFANLSMGGIQNQQLMTEAALQVTNARANYENTLARMNNAIAIGAQNHATATGTAVLSAESQALISNTLAQNANAAAATKANASRIGIASSFATVGSRLGVIALIVAALLATILALDYALTGTTRSLDVMLLKFKQLGGFLGTTLIYALQLVALYVGTSALGFMLLWKWMSEVFTLGFADTGYMDKLISDQEQLMRQLGSRMDENLKEIGSNVIAIGTEWQASAAEQAAKIRADQLKKHEEALKAHTDNIQRLINESKAGIKQANTELIAAAAAGSSMALEEVVKGSKAVILQMLADINKTIDVQKNTLKVLQSGKTEPWMGNPTPEQRKAMIQSTLEAKANADMRRKLIMDAIEAGDTQAKKSFAQDKQNFYKKYILDRDSHKATLDEQINFWEVQKKLLYTTYKGETSIQQEIIDSLERLKEEKASKLKEAADKEKELVADRVSNAKDALSNELDQMKKEIDDRNKIEIKAINDFYDKKIQAIEDGIEAERRLYQDSETKLTKDQLEKERSFLIRSIDKDAIKRVAEIDKELRKIENDKKIRQMQDNAVEQKALLEQQRNDALQAQETLVNQRLQRAKESLDAKYTEFEKQIQSGKISLFGFTKEIDDLSIKLSESLLNQGANWTKQLIDNIKNAKPLLSAAISDLMNLLETKTGLGELKTVGVNEFALLSDLSASDTLAKASPQLNSPLNYFRQLAGTTNNFNAPFVQINGVTLKDNMDVNTFGQNLFDAMNNNARSQGLTIMG